MYTGIVQDQLTVVSVERREGFMTFCIKFPSYLL